MPSLPAILGRQKWVWALSGQDDLELQCILHRTPGKNYGAMDEKYVLAELSRRRKSYDEPRKRQHVMTTGGGEMDDPAFAWLSEQEWARYKELTTHHMKTDDTLPPDSRLARLVRDMAEEKKIIQQCLRTGAPLPEHIKVFKFLPGTFDTPTPLPPTPMKTTESVIAELLAAGFEEVTRPAFPPNPYCVTHYVKAVRDTTGVRYALRVNQNEYPDNAPGCYRFVFRGQLVDDQGRDCEISTVTWTLTGESPNASLSDVESFYREIWFKLGSVYRKVYGAE